MRYSLFTQNERDAHFKQCLDCLPDWSLFRQRGLKCGRTDYWSQNTYYCRTYGCPRCRAREIGRQQKRLISRYRDATREKLVSVTICFAICSTLEDVGDEWIRFRKRMNYLVERKRKSSSRWLSFNLSGALEIMPFTGDEIPIMGSQQQEMLGAMTLPRPVFEGGHLWLPHIHAIVHAPDLDWQEVRDLLAEAWPHPFQIHAEPFYDWRDKNDSISSLAFYQLKYEPGRILGNTLFPWPVAWMAELYEWATSFSRSYQSFKFSIGAKKRISAIDTLKDIADRCGRDSVSNSPILYTESGECADFGATVDLPLVHGEPDSAYYRWEMEEWCRSHCRSTWRRQWLAGTETARFKFATDVDAVEFKLRFSNLLSGPP